MEIRTYNIPTTFEILPSICISKIDKYFILMLAWGTITIEISQKIK